MIGPEILNLGFRNLDAEKMHNDLSTEFKKKYKDEEANFNEELEIRYIKSYKLQYL